MLEALPIAFSLEVYFVFLTILGVIIGVLLWLQKQRETKARELFIARYETSTLRMSPYKIGLVYLVVKEGKDEVGVVPIWDAKSKVVDGKKLCLPPDELMPYDPARFS